MRKIPWRGLVCLLLLPWHTVLLAGAALVAALARPRGHAVLGPARLWCRVVLGTAGVRVRARPHTQSLSGPYLIVANHQSLFDIPALATAWTGPFRMVAKQVLFYIPVFGWALWFGGFVPVDRSRRERAIAALSRAVDTLRRGTSVVMFAEGTRSPDGRLRAMKKGPFRLAQQTGVPLLPVTISGSRAVLPRQRWLPTPGTIDVVVGAPLPPPRPGEPVEDVMQATAAALQAGYSARHRDDLIHEG